MKIILPILTVLFMTACSFNKAFLSPIKISQIPPDKEEVTITVSVNNDTTLVVCQSKTFQPIIKDTLKRDFTIESVVFKSENGNNLNGWFLKPKNCTPTITLLHFHGNAGCLLSLLLHQVQTFTPLLKYGFQIFVFDYSGFGFSEGKATRQNVLIDGNSALTYLKNRDDVKNTKLVIYGQSLGGHLSAVVAQQRQTDIDGLVIEGAFSSHKDMSAIYAGFLGRMLVSEKYSAYKSIRTYIKPLLIIHSSEDKVIPIKMGEKIYKNANEPKEFYEIKECHICGPAFYADSISSKIENMLRTR